MQDEQTVTGQEVTTGWGRVVSILEEIAEGYHEGFLRAEALRVFPELLCGGQAKREADCLSPALGDHSTAVGA